MARASINWARGLDELGTGILRQVDIGGKAYEGAMAAEADTRAENRALRAERRARQDRLDAEDRAYTRLKETEKRAFTQSGLELDREMTARFDLWTDQKEKEWAHLKETGKATKQHEVLKASYEQNAETAKDLMEAWIESNTDMSSPQYLKAWRAEQNAISSWVSFASSAGIEIGPPQEFSRLLARTAQSVHAEVAQSMRGEEEWADFVKALQQEKGGALEDAEKTISEAIEALGITLPSDERQKMVTLVIESFVKSPNLREGTVTVGDDDTVDLGDGAVEPRFRHQAGDPLDRIEEANLEVGVHKQALADQGRPGKSGPRGTQGAEWRDPEWLLPRLQTELKSLISQRDSPGRGGAGGAVRPALTEKINRVQALILKMEALIDEAGASVVDDTSGASLEVVPQRGIIAAADQGLPTSENLGATAEQLFGQQSMAEIASTADAKAKAILEGMA